MDPRKSLPLKARRPRPAARAAPPRPKPRAVDEERLTVEIVCAGRDVLRGRTPPTNLQEIATFLSQRGAVIRRVTIVDDSSRAIAQTLTEALTRGTRLVVTVGGLGPMNDDRTTAAVADALQVPLALNTHAKDMVEEAYRKLHRQRLVSTNGLTRAREKMCSLPIGSEPIPNAAGIPPGVLARREIETPTSDESSLRPLLDTLSREFPSLWIQSHTPEFELKDAKVRVSIEAGGADKQEAEALVEDALRRLISLAAGA